MLRQQTRVLQRGTAKHISLRKRVARRRPCVVRAEVASKNPVADLLDKVTSGTKRMRVANDDGNNGSPKPQRAARGTQRLQLPKLNLTEQLTRTLRLPMQRGGQRGVRDGRTVFVAGATGRLGVRLVRELLKSGFKVRAGDRDTDRAMEYIELAKALGALTSDELRRLSVVEVDYEDESSIMNAVGNAGKVICTLGLPQDALMDTVARGGDVAAIDALVDACARCGVQQFTLVSPLSGGGGGGLGALFGGLFGGSKTNRRGVEASLQDSGMPYTIVRTGSMDQVSDGLAATHNLVVARSGSASSGIVSRLQVAEFLTGCCANDDLSRNKVMEVVASERAEYMELPQLLEMVEAEVTMEELLARKQEREENEAALADAEAALETAEGARLEARERSINIEQRLKELSAQFTDAQRSAKAAIQDASSAEAQMEALREDVNSTSLRAQAASAILEAARRAARDGRKLTDQERSDILEAVFNPPQQEEEEQVTQKAGGDLFGGLFGGPGRLPAIPAVAAAAPVQEAAVEEVEEAVEEVVEQKKPRAGGLAALFGAPRRRQAQPVAQEAEEEEEAETVAQQEPEVVTRQATKMRAGLFSKKAAPQQQEAVEEEAAPAKATDRDETPSGTRVMSMQEIARERRLAAQRAKEEEEEKRRRDEEALRAFEAVEAERKRAAAQEIEEARRRIEAAAAAAKAEEEAQAKARAEAEAKEKEARLAAAKAAADAAAEEQRRRDEAAKAEAAKKEAARYAKLVESEKKNVKRWIANYRTASEKREQEAIAAAQREAEAQRQREEKEKAEAIAAQKREEEAQRKREEQEKSEAIAAQKREEEEQRKREEEQKAREEADKAAAAAAQTAKEEESRRAAEADAQAEAARTAEKEKVGSWIAAYRARTAELQQKAEEAAQVVVEAVEETATDAAETLSNAVAPAEDSQPAQQENEESKPWFRWPWQSWQRASTPAAVDNTPQQVQAEADDGWGADDNERPPAREWIASWRARNGNGSDEPENVLEAREWIRSWRARTLEQNLPVSADVAVSARN